MTALGMAATMGATFVCHALLGAGADPEVRDSIGYTPLRQAGHLGHVECVTALLQGLFTQGTTSQNKTLTFAHRKSFVFVCVVH